MGFLFKSYQITYFTHARYIISCSNSFITFDVVTSDLARQVYPKVEGLMIGLELSPDNKFAAAWTNNNQTILLNTLISEFFIIDSPLKVGVNIPLKIFKQIKVLKFTSRARRLSRAWWY